MNKEPNGHAPVERTVRLIWNHISNADPPTDGETQFVGINSIGFAGCFDHYRNGTCWINTAEDGSIEIFNGLEWWAVLALPNAELTCPTGRGKDHE